MQDKSGLFLKVGVAIILSVIAGFLTSFLGLGGWGATVILGAYILYELCLINFNNAQKKNDDEKNQLKKDSEIKKD